MKLKTVAAALTAALVLAPGLIPTAAAETQFPKRVVKNVDPKAVEEFRVLYERIEAALKEENVGKIMDFYAEDYLHHGITKKQLKFMWLEALSNFEDLYSVHVFTKVTISGNDAVLVCTGGLFGIARKGEDYTTVDRWVIQPHWLTKVGGKWKMIGGATHQSRRRKGGRLELHPFF